VKKCDEIWTIVPVTMQAARQKHINRQTDTYADANTLHPYTVGKVTNVNGNL